MFRYEKSLLINIFTINLTCLPLVSVEQVVMKFTLWCRFNTGENVNGIVFIRSVLGKLVDGVKMYVWFVLLSVLSSPLVKFTTISKTNKQTRKQ